jgi:hypothetical protein
MKISKRAVVGALVATLGVGAVAPARSHAGIQDVNKTYKVTVNSTVLVAGNQIGVKVLVKQPESSVSGWWSSSTVTKVVRAGINNGLEQPYQSQGYRCTPKVVKRPDTTVTSFTCTLRGADVPTTSTLYFTALYGPPTGP